MCKNDILVLIDNGHGKYSENRKVDHSQSDRYYHVNSTFYEGWGNRKRSKYLEKNLSQLGIPYLLVSAPVSDTPLQTRVDIANHYALHYKYVIYISIHSNAGGGHGVEVYTSPGETKSDELAKYILFYTELLLPKYRIRKGQEGLDKEAKFFVLVKTSSNVFAILDEFLFHDHKDEVNDLMDDNIQMVRGHVITLAILQFIRFLNN